MNQHLSPWDQEEYVLGQRTPAMNEHLQACPACCTEIARLENGVSLFRNAALSSSAASLAARPPARLGASTAPRTAIRTWGWPLAQVAAAAMLLLMLLIIHPWTRHGEQKKAAVQHAAAISDDALLQQVDDQLYVAVPASMESLAHLVNADSSQSHQAAGTRSRQHVQTN